MEQLDQLITQYLGKPVKLFPNNLPAQCFEWATKWTDTLGIPHAPGNPSPFPFENASQIYTDFGDFQQKYFDRIENTPDAIPQKGDIVVWSGEVNNGPGHVAVAEGKNNGTITFWSYDQNWLRPIVEEVQHDYKYVLGWLRPKALSPTTSSNSTSTSPLEAKWSTYTNALKKYPNDLDYSYYTDDLGRIVDDIYKYKNSLTVSRAEVEKLKSDNDSLTNDNKTLQQSLFFTEKEVDEKQAQIDALSKQVQNLPKPQADQTAEIEALKGQIKDVTDKLIAEQQYLFRFLKPGDKGYDFIDTLLQVFKKEKR